MTIRAAIAARLTRLERLPPRRTAESTTPALPLAGVIVLEKYCCKRWFGKPWPLGFDDFDLRNPTTAAQLHAALEGLRGLPLDTTTEDYARALGALLGDA